MESSVRRSGRQRHAPTTKFQDMEVTLRPSKGSVAKAVQKQEQTSLGHARSPFSPSKSSMDSTPQKHSAQNSGGRKRRRSARSNLWLNRPKKKSQPTTEQHDPQGDDENSDSAQEDDKQRTNETKEKHAGESGRFINEQSLEAGNVTAEVAGESEILSDALAHMSAVADLELQLSTNGTSAITQGVERCEPSKMGEAADGDASDGEEDSSEMEVSSSAIPAFESNVEAAIIYPQSEEDKNEHSPKNSELNIPNSSTETQQLEPITDKKPVLENLNVPKNTPVISMKSISQQPTFTPLPQPNSLPDIIIKLDASSQAEGTISSTQSIASSEMTVNSEPVVISNVGQGKHDGLIQEAGKDSPEAVVLSVDSTLSKQTELQVLSQVAGVLPNQGTVQLMLVESGDIRVTTQPADGDAPSTADIPTARIVQLADNSIAKDAACGPSSTDEFSSSSRHGRRHQDGLVEVKDGKYHCKVCSYTTDKRGNWYKHRTSHVGTRRYPCPECKYQAKTSSNLRRHLLIHADIKTHVCNICSQAFRQKIHLIHHIEYKHLEKSVQCPLCDFTCANMNPGLVLHMKRKHDAETILDGKLNGKISKEIIEKISNVQAAVKKYKCPECDFGPVSKKDLQQHQKFHKKGPEIKFFCEHCSFVTDCHSRLQRHMMVHTKEKPYVCGECYYQASQKEHVLRHLKAKHGIEVSEGSVKRKRIKTTSSSSAAAAAPTAADMGQDCSEVVAFAMQPPPVRSESKRKFLPTGSECKRKYMAADFCTQEKHFGCNFCTMKFTKLINLHKHVHIQHQDLYSVDDSQLHCVVCNYTTTNRKNLLVHMRKHTFPRGSNTITKTVTYAFSCVLCDFSSEIKDRVYSHMREEHNMYLVKGDEVPTVPKNGESGFFLPPRSKESSTDNEEEQGTCSKDDGKCTSPSDDAIVIDLPPANTIDTNQSAGPTSSPTSPDALSVGGGKTVLVQLAPGGPLTSVQIDPPSNSHLSLQDIVSPEKLALLDLVDAQDTDSGVIAVEQPTATQAEAQDTQETSNSEMLTCQAPADNVSVDSADGSSEDGKMQLSADQLSQLSRGDYIEINGEMYTVEVTED